MPEVENVLQVEDTVICSGVAEMVVPSGGAHVRSTGIRFPFAFVERPSVTATVRAVTGPAVVGVVFGIWSVEVSDLTAESSQVAIHAANVSQEGVPHKGDFVCDYIIVGKVK